MNRLLIKNCVPAIIALTLTGLYSVIDGLFIGNAQGDNGLAAINIAWPVTALITAAGTGIGTGGSILYASFCGIYYRMYRFTFNWYFVRKSAPIWNFILLKSIQSSDYYITKSGSGRI